MFSALNLGTAYFNRPDLRLLQHRQSPVTTQYLIPTSNTATPKPRY